MKTMAKSLVLVLLVAVICSATYIAATAAEDFPDDEEMVATVPSSATARSLDGTALGGVQGSSNLENAPALRVDYSLSSPEVSLNDDEEPELSDEDTTFEASPDTGLEDFGMQTAAALFLLVGAVVAGKRKELPRA